MSHQAWCCETLPAKPYLQRNCDSRFLDEKSWGGKFFFKPVLFLESNVTSIEVTVGYVILLGRLQGFFSTAVGAASLHRRGLPQGTLYVQEYSFSHVFARVLCQMEWNRCHHCVQGANLLQNGLGNATVSSIYALESTVNLITSLGAPAVLWRLIFGATESPKKPFPDLGPLQNINPLCCTCLGAEGPRFGFIRVTWKLAFSRRQEKRNQLSGEFLLGPTSACEKLKF